MEKGYLKELIDECHSQINDAKISHPDITPALGLCFIFYTIILVPFIIFPILSKFEAIKPYIEGIDISKFDKVITNNSIHILFYAIPAMLVITHAISVSSWKSNIPHVMKLRESKLFALRIATVIELRDTIPDDLKKTIIFPSANGNKVIDNNAKKDPKGDNTGIPSIDILMKILDKLDKLDPPQVDPIPKT